MTQPRVGRRLDPEQRREQLLDAAVDLAAGGDVGAVSVQDLARRAGVSEGLLYHYFPTKDALVAAALRRAADALLAELDIAATSDGSPQERLAAGLAAYLDHVELQPTGWRAALQAHSGDLAALSAELEAHSFRLILDAVDVEEPSPALRVALSGWLAFERDACLAWIDNPDVPRAAIEAILLGSFVATLTAMAEHDAVTRDVVARLLNG